MIKIGALLFIGLFYFQSAFGQDLEPRRWSHLPNNLNVFGVGYIYSEAEVFFNPVLQIKDAEATLNNFAASYMRTFNWAGRSARIDVLLPYTSGQWEGLVDDMEARIRRRGNGDPRLRLSVDLIGAPSLSGQAYLDYKAKNPTNTVVGAAISLTVPLGKYCDDCLVNIGKNRWMLRPQLGVLHTRGPWSFELTGSVFLFSKNDRFLGYTTLTQDPLLAVQAHTIYAFPGNWWLGLSTGYAKGGRIQVEDINTQFTVDNWIWGATFGFNIGANQSVKLTWLSGRTQNLVGRNSDNIALSWTLRWAD